MSTSTLVVTDTVVVTATMVVASDLADQSETPNLNTNPSPIPPTPSQRAPEGQQSSCPVFNDAAGIDSKVVRAWRFNTT